MNIIIIIIIIIITIIIASDNKYYTITIIRQANMEKIVCEVLRKYVHSCSNTMYTGTCIDEISTRKLLLHCNANTVMCTRNTKKGYDYCIFCMWHKKTNTYYVKYDTINS